MEKHRLVPEGGRHFRLPAGGALRTDGFASSVCGPDGVRWLLVQYVMPDHTCQLRLTNLITGNTSVLLTAGRRPEPMTSDDSSDDEEDCDEDLEDAEERSMTAAGGACGQLLAGDANDAAAPAAEGDREELHNQAGGADGAAATAEAAQCIAEQVTSVPQPSAQIAIPQNCPAAVQQPVGRASIAPAVASCSVQQKSAHQTSDSRAQARCMQQQHAVHQASEDLLSAGHGPPSNSQPSSSQLASPDQPADMDAAHPVSQTCSSPQPSQPNPQEAATHAADLPGSTLDTCLWPFPLPGLGLRDEVAHWEFLEDGKHVFLEGSSLDTSNYASCWQVLSIPDGLTTALAWRTTRVIRKELAAGKFIVAQIGSSIVTFHMATLQEAYTIDLQQFLRKTAGEDLIPLPHMCGREMEVNGALMALELESSTGHWVYVFEISTGQPCAVHRLPPQHEVQKLTWMAPEPMPILAIQHCKYSSRRSCGGKGRSELWTNALHISDGKRIHLSRVDEDPEGAVDSMIWPAPAGLLVLGLHVNRGRPSHLHVTDVMTGRPVWQCLLEYDQAKAYTKRKSTCMCTAFPD